ncbi:MAG: BACON domain-containing protein [Bacteroidales bacterium]|nr:BACON domain-containing protein [Bacteroidales bacterium]MBP3663456.1 BACON domain-containing protein [Bacteroidales bacterium]
MKRTLIYILMALSLSLVSCESEIFAPIQTLEVDRAELVAPGIGASYSVSVSSNTSWQAELTAEEWISCDVENFVGSATVNIVFGANEGESRSCELVLSSEDGSITRRVTLRQGAVMEDGQITIAELRSHEAEGEYVFSGSSRIKGFVTTDLEASNFYPNSFAIQDGFADGADGITVSLAEQPDFLRGEEVEVDLDGAVLKRNEDGMLVLAPAKKPARTQATRIGIEPMVAKMHDLAAGEYESMLVSVYNLQPSEESIGATLNDGVFMENSRGARAFVKIFKTSLLSEVTCPDGSGSVTGIAGAAAPEDGHSFIIPMAVSDLVFETERFKILTGGVSSFPYVLSLYSDNGTNESNEPKYIDYEVIPYDPSTKFIDAFYYDKDRSTDVSLYVHASGRTEEEVRSSLYWGNNMGFDCIPAKSFVTRMSAAGEYPGESYYLLTMPMKNDFVPAGGTFSVAFYIYNTNWAIRDWKLEYSLDMNNWHGYDEASGTGEGVLEFMPGGNYTLYNVRFTAQTAIEATDILYIRLSPFGKRACINPGSIATGWGSDVRLSVGMLVCPHVPRPSEAPQNTIWHHTFDSLTEGADYLMGDRLGLFDNLNGPLMGAWNAEQRNGMSGSNVAMRPGYAQVGYAEYATDGIKATSYKGSLQTPALGVTGDVTLTFKAMAFQSSRSRRTNMHNEVPEKGPDATEIEIEITDGGHVAELDGEATGDVPELIVSGLPVSEFKTFTLRIKDVTENTRIVFRSAEEKEFARWFIDDIIVTE